MEFVDYKCLESLLIEGEEMIATEGAEEILSNVITSFKKACLKIFGIIKNILLKIKHKITSKYTQEDVDNHITKVTETKSVQEMPYFTDGRSCFVKVGVTVGGIEYIEYFPIMGLKNDAIRATAVTMTDVNKALQRAFVKACARHGLGLYIYAGEDVPEAEKNAPVEVSNATDFKSVQTDVINLVKKLVSTSAEQEVTRYIMEMFPGIKLSMTTEEHLDKLLAARTYLSELQYNLGK